jgi:sulfur carrier protein ThiS
MRITLTAYSILRDMLPPESGGKVEVELTEGATLRALLEKVGIPKEAACAINGTIQRDHDVLLHESDKVSAFRPGSGGMVGLDPV